MKLSNRASRNSSKPGQSGVERAVICFVLLKVADCGCLLLFISSIPREKRGWVAANRGLEGKNGDSWGQAPVKGTAGAHG